MVQRRKIWPMKPQMRSKVCESMRYDILFDKSRQFVECVHIIKIEYNWQLTRTKIVFGASNRVSLNFLICFLSKYLIILSSISGRLFFSLYGGYKQVSKYRLVDRSREVRLAGRSLDIINCIGYLETINWLTSV